MAALSVEQYRGLLAGLVAPKAPQLVPVAECRGLVLAQDVESKLPVPPFTNSAMDGFAVRASDIAGRSEIRLPVVADVPAGATDSLSLPPGSAARIMTGAPLPDGADTVVKVELTDHSGRGPAPGVVRISPNAPAYANVRHVGEAVGVGSLVLERGQVLDAAAVSAAVSVGYGELLVYPRPRVAVVTTGTELVAPGLGLGTGQIPDSNSLLISGLVEQGGGLVEARLMCGDDPAELSRALAACSELDLVVTAGGISAGAYEVVRQALEQTAAFHHVAQQPGGPQGCGHFSLGNGRRVPVVCMPGNPVSVFVTFYVYVNAVIACLRGVTELVQAPRTVPAVAGVDWSAPTGKVQFVPVRIVGADESGCPVVSPVHKLGSRSHLVTALPLADALAVVEPVMADVANSRRREGGVCEGERIEIIPVR